MLHPCPHHKQTKSPSGTEARPTLTRRHTDSVETITVTTIEMQFQSKEGLQECL